MKIFLCRHGQTTGDIEDRYGGDYDDHLTDSGKIQASKLSQQLKNKKVDIIISSSKIRAKETAKILSKTLSCKIIEVKELRERNQYGVLTGMVKSEAKKVHPDLVEQLKDYTNTIEAAEDYDSFSQRVHSAMFNISKKDYKTVVVVTHGGPIKAILRKIKYSPNFKVADCAFAELDTTDKEIKIIRLNNIEPIDTK